MSAAVTTWADGFGAWHARVTFVEPRPAPSYADGEAQQVRATALQAIRYALELRGNGEPITVRLRLGEVEVGADGLARSITYVEGDEGDEPEEESPVDMSAPVTPMTPEAEAYLADVLRASVDRARAARGES